MTTLSDLKPGTLFKFANMETYRDRLFLRVAGCAGLYMQQPHSHDKYSNGFVDLKTGVLYRDTKPDEDKREVISLGTLNDAIEAGVTA